MALLEKQLRVRRSGLPGAGRGLFTTKFIPRNTRIVEYKGRISKWRDADHDNNGNIYFVNRNHVIDARPHKQALARYANDARGITRVTGLTNNAEYEEDGLKVYIKSTKDIHAGTEIFVSYGKEYWDVIRHNRRLEEKERKKKKSALKNI